VCDLVDGRLKLTEVNARHWLQRGPAIVAGVPLPCIAHSDALGRRIDGVCQVDGMRCLYVWREASHSLVEFIRGQMSVGTLAAGLRNVRVGVVRALEGPGPALREIAR
jgi:predicted ATP-grasp superfamily ATP-dependent carboligase